MKLLYVLSLFLLATVLSSAQSSVKQPEQQSVLIIKHSWRETHRDVGFRGFPATNDNGNGVPTPHAPKFIKVYLYSLTIRNVGAKTIRILGWDYLFIDPDTDKRISAHHFQSVVKIKQGQKRSILEISISPPTKTVTASALGRGVRAPFNEKVVITCIGYADGSVWRSDTSASDSCQPVRNGRR